MGEQPTSPSIEVVVVNWRRADLTLACLESLRDEVARDGRSVTVVDNGSGDGSAERLRAGAPWARHIALAENAGFAAGVNAAMTGTNADIVVLLNNDALATPGLVDHLTAPFRETPELAATTARILLLESDGTVGATNSTGNVVDADGNGGDRDWLAPHPADSPPDVFGFCGGACALRVQAVDDVGPLDESLFMYYEDTDLSWRLRRRGWAIQYVSDATALHRHASSSGVDSEIFIVSNTRNRLVVALRHGPWAMVRRAVLRTVARVVLDATAGLLRPAARRRALWRAKGFVQFVTTTSASLAERRRVDATATTSRAAVVSILGRDAPPQ